MKLDAHAHEHVQPVQAHVDQSCTFHVKSVLQSRVGVPRSVYHVVLELHCSGFKLIVIDVGAGSVAPWARPATSMHARVRIAIAIGIKAD